MADVKRLHYFNHQFLVEADFTDEQQYHLTMRRRHNQALHTYGVADGLAVEKTGDKEITVQPGMAIDRNGQELVLLDPRVVSLSQGAGSTVYITITYHEEPSDPTTATGVKDDTRFTERPEVQAVTTAPPSDGSVIRLAQFVLDGSGNVPGNIGDTFTQGRQLASTVLAPASVATSELADGAVSGPKLANNAVTEAKVANSAVTTAKIADNAVTDAKLATSAVTTAKIADNAVTEAKLATNAVTTVKIADNMVSENKLATAVRGKLVTNGDTHDHAGGDGAQIRHSALNLDGGTNPHGTTAADVGAMPAAGGTVSGNLQVNGSIGVGSVPQPGVGKLYAVATDGSAGTVAVAAGAASSDGRGTVTGLTVDVSGSGAGVKRGILISASGAGTKQAGYFSAASAAGSSNSTNALSAFASSEGTDSVTGLQIGASGSGTGWKQGITCYATDAGPKRAGQFTATSAASSSDYTNALYAEANSEGSGQSIGLVTSAYGDGTGNKYGVYSSVSGGGTKYGVYSSVSGEGTRYAGYFAGNVHVAGTLSKSSGTFLIDHPLDPENKTLRHSFVESPEDLCLYRGKTKLDSKGQATVKMPEYFAALTKEDEATVSLTPIGSKPFLTGYEWNRNFTAFTIYGDAGREVSYLVLANRDDPVIHQLRRPVEEKKGDGHFEKGQFLNPEVYGKTPEMPFGLRGIGPTGASPEGAEAPIAPAAFASMEEERQRMEKTLAKAREEQQQRIEAFRQEEEPRRKQLEETLAAIQPQPDRPSE